MGSGRTRSKSCGRLRREGNPSRAPSYPSERSPPDIFVPQPGVVTDESAHQVDTGGILEHVERDAARSQELLLADERLVLPDDDSRNPVEQHGAAAHRTR